jgi:hypothetical protein
MTTYSKNVKIGFFGSKTVDPIGLVLDKIKNGELQRDRNITMTNKHDYKGGSEALTTDTPVARVLREMLDVRFYGAIQSALRIADRVQSGEVSFKMCEQFFDYIDDGTDEKMVCDIYKAMTAQMIKECED